MRNFGEAYGADGMLVVTDHDGGFGEEIKVVKADGALQLLLEDRVEDFSPAHIGKYISYHLLLQ